jgi:monoamine oxidase
MATLANPQIFDIVGAGLSGLASTRALRREGKEVVVLEARERPGGRILRSARFQRGGGRRAPLRLHRGCFGRG